MVKLGNSWDMLLADEFSKDYYQELRKNLAQEYRTHTIYPTMENIFNALKYTSYEDVKVLILGQDPYHGPNQAHGLCFSVQKGVDKPPSLKNMFKELESDLGICAPSHGCLTDWAKQGILLLNTVLTVREGEPNSHKKLGWTIFTNRIIQLLNERPDPVIFVLWGRNALEKLPFITNNQHYVLSAAHPSPLSASRGFFGCKHYSKINEILESIGKTPIDWRISE